MTDIVERLRRVNMDTMTENAMDAARDAADEIESLRMEVRRWQTRSTMLDEKVATTRQLLGP